MMALRRDGVVFEAAPGGAVDKNVAEAVKNVMEMVLRCITNFLPPYRQFFEL